jgi:hypothetical protein
VVGAVVRSMKAREVSDLNSFAMRLIATIAD